MHYMMHWMCVFVCFLPTLYYWTTISSLHLDSVTTVAGNLWYRCDIWFILFWRLCQLLRKLGSRAETIHPLTDELIAHLNHWMSSCTLGNVGSRFYKKKECMQTEVYGSAALFKPPNPYVNLAICCMFDFDCSRHNKVHHRCYPVTFFQAYTHICTKHQTNKAVHTRISLGLLPSCCSMTQNQIEMLTLIFTGYQAVHSLSNSSSDDHRIFAVPISILFLQRCHLPYYRP